MGFIGFGLFAAAFLLAIRICVTAAFLLWGAKIAGIENRSYGGAVVVTVVGGIAGAVLGAVLRIVPVIGGALGFIVGLLVCAWMMTRVFQTAFRRALAASVLAWVLGFAVVALLTLSCRAAM